MKELPIIRLECIQIVNKLQNSVDIIKDAKQLEQSIIIEENFDKMYDKLRCAKIAVLNSYDVEGLVILTNELFEYTYS